MSDPADFQALQYEFAAHIRDPEKNPAPSGIEDRRLAIYRELFFNNVAKMLAGTFPVLSGILGASRWRDLMRDYFARHQAQTPYFLEMPTEFLSFLQDERQEHQDDLPFMLELAHYEWVELALSVDEREITYTGVNPEGDLMQGELAVSPLVQVLAYRFPVHRIGPDYQEVSPPPEPTWLMVYRNPEDRVEFMEINQVTARLWELACAGGQSGLRILEQVAAELGHQRPEVVINGGQEILQMLKGEAIILGTLTTDH